VLDKYIHSALISLFVEHDVDDEPYVGINRRGREELLVVVELAKKIPNFMETERLVTVVPVLK